LNGSAFRKATINYPGEDAMNRRMSGVLAIAAFVVACLLGNGQTLAQNAYITNVLDNTVSVIATATNTLTATIPVGVNPLGVVVTPDGSSVYVTNQSSATVCPPNPPALCSTVSVIATTTNTVVATIPVGIEASGVAVTPDGSKVYVVNTRDNTVSVIATATNTVTATIPVGRNPVAFGIFIQPRFAGTPGAANCYARVSRRLCGCLADSMPRQQRWDSQAWDRCKMLSWLIAQDENLPALTRIRAERRWEIAGRSVLG
jgi:YVTN family beta-propeller protein